MFGELCCWRDDGRYEIATDDHLVTERHQRRIRDAATALWRLELGRGGGPAAGGRLARDKDYQLTEKERWELDLEMERARSWLSMYGPGPYALDWNLERGRDDEDAPYIVPTLPEPFDVVDFELEKGGTMEVLGWSDIMCPHPRRAGVERAGPIAWVRAGFAGGVSLVQEACSVAEV